MQKSVENLGMGTKGIPRLFIKGDSTEVAIAEVDECSFINCKRTIDHD